MVNMDNIGMYGLRMQGMNCTVFLSSAAGVPINLPLVKPCRSTSSEHVHDRILLAPFASFLDFLDHEPIFCRGELSVRPLSRHCANNIVIFFIQKGGVVGIGVGPSCGFAVYVPVGTVHDGGAEGWYITISLSFLLGVWWVLHTHLILVHVMVVSQFIQPLCEHLPSDNVQYNCKNARGIYVYVLKGISHRQYLSGTTCL